jgi:hypothetical protein
MMLQKHTGENLVLQAIMDEHEENRELGNLTADILNREKVTNTLFSVYIQGSYLVEKGRILYCL